MSVILSINPGGSSKKYALFVDGRIVIEAVFEKNADTYQSSIKRVGAGDVVSGITKEEYNHAVTSFASLVKNYLQSEQKTLASIGVRVLASGSYFQKHASIDEVYLSLLRTKESTAPLHIPATLSEIQQSRENFPGVPVIAVSDTALFKSLPPVMREYSLARETVKELDIHRFGYHGLSVNSIISRIHSITGRDPERMIVCHVGSGISVTGLKNGTPVYTSTGYSSLGNLPMTTRAGDVDGGVIVELLRSYQGKFDELVNSLHKEGGLLGLAGSDDVRRILDRKSQGDTEAAFAIEKITYALQEKIAEATVATGGVDALVFTGTIGVRSPEFRRLAVDRLGHFGIGIDEDKNNLFLSKEGVVSQARSLVKVAVMRTDEMGEIARTAAHYTELANS